MNTLPVRQTGIAEVAEESGVNIKWFATPGTWGFHKRVTPNRHYAHKNKAYLSQPREELSHTERQDKAAKGENKGRDEHFYGQRVLGTKSPERLEIDVTG